ncbi:MAG TPA: hypothetical protein VHX86_11305 [Tepidisphaeraceae bacterium]|nr:hypothetical protein [Tepidisphaeraceae bacterium]
MEEYLNSVDFGLLAANFGKSASGAVVMTVTDADVTNLAAGDGATDLDTVQVTGPTVLKPKATDILTENGKSEIRVRQAHDR